MSIFEVSGGFLEIVGIFGPKSGIFKLAIRGLCSDTIYYPENPFGGMVSVISSM